MNSREFRKRIADILAGQREERLEMLRDEVRAERKPSHRNPEAEDKASESLVGQPIPGAT